MQVRNINNNYSKSAFFKVNFKGAQKSLIAENIDKYTPSKAKEEKPKSSKARKIGAGIASAIYPGLGQLANGQWLKAIGFAIGVPLVSTLGFLAFGYYGILASSLLHIYNIYDASKNA
ncbi:hypothetical protein IJS77_04070 [bacterium]|nr:hypothetical protein [bacterium]